LLARGFWCKVL